MRSPGSYRLKPRQLRALVLLLALLPLVPMTFVVRFVAENIADQRLETRERAKPIYQQFLDSATSALVAGSGQLWPSASAPDPADSWRPLLTDPAFADTVLLVAPDSRLAVPDVPPGEARIAPAASLAEAVLDNGVRYAGAANSGRVRWRFFCEAPEPLYGLRPPAAAAATPGPTLLFIKSRQHLLEAIGNFYRRELDPQSVLRVLDENGEDFPLRGPDGSVPPAGGEPMAESTLQPPLPAWRVQLFSVDTSLVDGIARGQIAFYWWSVAGMFAVTAVIAGTAAWTLTRRSVLHELSNDALAVVSHEMKTPLASMRMFIETLRDRRYHGGPEQADEYLGLIADENTRLVRLVESFQTLSRLENPHGKRRLLRREDVRADEIIAAARARLGPRLEALDGAFQVSVSDPPPEPFPADREALTAVLVNLLDNALKYSDDDPRVEVRVFARGGQVMFEVSDNGIGIDPAEHGRIFERFYQSDRRLSRVHEGCGLGLNIVRAVMRAHGGAVAVRSKPGEGSTFTVRLPGR